jgi:hypothetical protein
MNTFPLQCKVGNNNTMIMAELSSIDKTLSKLLAMVQGNLNNLGSPYEAQKERHKIQKVLLEALASNYTLSKEASELCKNLFKHQNDRCFKCKAHQDDEHPHFGKLICDPQDSKKTLQLGYIVTDQEELLNHQYQLMKAGNKTSYRLYPKMSEKKAALYVLLGMLSPCFVKSWNLQKEGGLLTEQLLTFKDIQKDVQQDKAADFELFMDSVEVASKLFGITDNMESWWNGKPENLDLGFRKIEEDTIIQGSDLLCAYFGENKTYTLKKGNYFPVFMQHSSSNFRYEAVSEEEKTGLGYPTKSTSLLYSLVKGSFGL